MVQLVSYSCYMGQKCPHTTYDTTGKLQLLYGTKNVPIQQMIQLVSYSCYMGQKYPYTTDYATGKLQLFYQTKLSP